jgi:cell division protein FtsB
MERGMAHGRVPIADGCVDKQALAAAAKSNRFCSRNNAAYQAVVHENEELKERNNTLNEANKKLNENNDILTEENSVNREMMLVIIIFLHVTTY